MVPGRVSIIIAARNERFLPPTVADLLSKARGDVELLVVLDGYWPTPPLPDDRRLRILHRGTALGMRPAINDAARVATGEYLMKVDGHVMVAEGYDAQLKADYQEDNWILTARRFPLDPIAWAFEQRTDDKYPIDYHYLDNPLARPDAHLHGVPWRQRRAERADVLLDDEMTSQGSLWFMSANHWQRLGEMDVAHYGTFVNEFQEIGMKTWLGGGACKVTKRTWYAHLYKGKTYGKGYALGREETAAGNAHTTRHWLGNHWSGRVRDFRWLIEHFAPVPGWPLDLDAIMADAHRRYAA